MQINFNEIQFCSVSIYSSHLCYVCFQFQERVQTGKQAAFIDKLGLLLRPHLRL